MDFEDFNNDWDVICSMTESFIDKVDDDRTKGIEISPILDKSRRMTQCLFDSLDISQTKPNSMRR